ncbi:Predicted divalent cation transporter [Phaffia rhodozyma]|uniref:Predicted divalent cation transporter n=1 Tax=Phaffia rhodozyma TaxID=264483 RepID=A0A0F7SF66_PHARH|nr:Predicted divalent cation transporter [Phaffia rhodozyma]
MSVFGPDGQSRSRAERREPKESIRGRWARGDKIIRGQTTALFGFEKPSRAGWREIKELVYEVGPTLLLTLLGLVFTGALLEHLSRWKVFERVDELFILVPMLANLKGNLEMCLGARLSTSANIGELDIRLVRRSLILGQLSLLQVQAIAIASLAGLVSFLLGLAMPHRVSADIVGMSFNQSMMTNRSMIALEEPRNLAVAAGLWLGERDDPDLGYIDSFKEGYTPPGAKELIMVLVTGIGAACLSGATLGGFMSGLVLLSRRLRINPDNICTPIASCLSDLVTLFILAVIGSFIVPYISTPLPLMILPIILLAGVGFTWITLRNEYVSDSINTGWTPLLVAVTISSATGVVLDRCVDRYEGFAILAVAMTGLSGAVGSIHASRLSTVLHFSEPLSKSTPDEPTIGSVSPRTIALALLAVSVPVLAMFILAVAIAGWMRVEWQLIVSFFIVAELTIAISLYLADRFTLCFWSRELDPDSHTLPILSSVIDLVGQLLLFVAFEAAAMAGGNVRVLRPLVVSSAASSTASLSSVALASTTAATTTITTTTTAAAAATMLSVLSSAVANVTSDISNL